MSDMTPERAAAKAALRKAINDYMRVHMVEGDDTYSRDQPVVSGWAVAVEYTSTGLEQDDRCGSTWIVEDSQPRAFSLGLFATGVERYT